MIGRFLFDEETLYDHPEIRKILQLNEKENPYKEINFDIEINPLPYARPRTSYKINGMYDPRAAYKKQVKKLIKEIIDNKDFNIALGEVKVEAIFYLNAPKTITESKKKSLLASLFFLKPLTRPDVDNYLKPVFDSMNGTIYKDDGQITSVNTVKVYTNKDQSYIHMNIKYREKPLKLR